MFKIIHFYMATTPTDIAFKSQKSCTESKKTSVINASNAAKQTSDVLIIDVPASLSMKTTKAYLFSSSEKLVSST
jgi:MinD-like ATPase involved in chromosome partitioning or flagellar assembly